MVETATICIAVVIWIKDEAQKAETANLNAAHSTELRKIEEKIGSIHRRLGDSDHLDVRKLMIHKSEFQKVPIGAAYFAEGSFYAVTNAGDWKHELVSYEDLVVCITGEKADSRMGRLLESSPLHIWRKKQSLSIRGSSVVSNLLTLIAVQKIPVDDVKDALGLDEAFSMSFTNTLAVPIDVAFEGQKVTLPAAWVTNNQIMSPVFTSSRTNTISLREALPGDVVGVLLADALEKLFLSTTFVSRELRGEIIELQKIDNVLYGQFRFTFKNATVNGVKYNEYYYNLEGMVIGLNPYVFVVVSAVPSMEPTERGPDFQWVSDWYRNFAVVVDP